MRTSDRGLAGARRWQFDSFSAGGGGSGGRDKTADEPATGKERAKRALEDAYQRGLAEGYQAGNAQSKAALEAYRQQFSVLLESTQAQATQFDHSIGDALLNLAFALARQIVRAELAARPELVADIAQEALASLPARVTMPVLHINPADMRFVQSDNATDAIYRVVADPGISRGGCKLVSEIGEIDATIESRWQSALQRLGAPSDEQNAG